MRLTSLKVPSPVVISYTDLKNAPHQLQSAIGEHANLFRCPKNQLQTIETPTEAAFGSHPKALGIIIVKDLPPNYSVLREDLLNFAYRFASLPENVKGKYVDPTTRYRCGASSFSCASMPVGSRCAIYSFGWSHGKVDFQSLVCMHEGNLMGLSIGDYERKPRYKLICRFCRNV